MTRFGLQPIVYLNVADPVPFDLMIINADILFLLTVGGLGRRKKMPRKANSNGKEREAFTDSGGMLSAGE